MSRLARQWQELFQRGFNFRGAAPLKVQISTGAVRFGGSGRSFQFDKIGAIGDGEPVPSVLRSGLSAVGGGEYVSRLNNLLWTRGYPALRFYVEFGTIAGEVFTPLPHGAISSCEVTAYRLQDNGTLTLARRWTPVAHLAEMRDDTCGGRPTLFVITQVEVDPGDNPAPTSMRIHVAGEHGDYIE